MNLPNTIQNAFDEALKAFVSSPTVTAILEGQCSREAYAGILSQIYHQTGWNPQLQALATMHFRGETRSEVARFLSHARSEVGHDEMAREDLRVLGYDVDGLQDSDPLPETAGLIGFATWQAQYTGPVGYLGYLFFLEFTPTTVGHAFRTSLEKAGIPRAAMTFLEEHIVVDEGHNQLMKRYVNKLVTTPEAEKVFVSSIRTTAKLYERMLESAAAAGPAALAPQPVLEVAH